MSPAICRSAVRDQENPRPIVGDPNRVDDCGAGVVEGEVWNRYYANIPCAATLVPTKSFATVGGIIEINLLALTNMAVRRKQVIAADIPGMAAYRPCVRTGEFLLPSGLMAIGQGGDVAGRTVSPGFASLSHAGYTQAATVYDYAEALCRAAGTSMANVLRAQYFVADLTAFLGIAMAWSAKTGARPHPFVCIQTVAAVLHLSEHVSFTPSEPTIHRRNRRSLQCQSGDISRPRARRARRLRFLMMTGSRLGHTTGA
jgi:enamine deaminase RidA (YjgF/YER057c/UK114 family)